MNGAHAALGKCPFAATLLRHDFGCDRALEVTRRGGAEIGCIDAQARPRCAALFEALKAAALPALGFEDDLTATPHSVYVKIQFGGLLGLMRLLGEAGIERVDNVRALVEQAGRQYGDPAAIPGAGLVSAISAYRQKGRGRSGSV